MNDYTASDWASIFEFNGLKTFDDFWQMNAQWYEEPNKRRGGWSGVARCELKLPEGGTVHAFLKRQENHPTRTLLHPIHGVLTFVREFNAIMLYRKLGIPALTPLYFGVRSRDGDRRAVLMTAELTGYVSLDLLAKGWATMPKARRRAISKAVASLLRQIHDNKLTHNCFNPKHVFIRMKGAEAEARVIDLEKTKKLIFGHDRELRDIRRLIDPVMPWSKTERVRFFREYMGVDKMTPAARAEWKRIQRRHEVKRKSSAKRSKH
ncbi:lipopolysaccharide kinase InaA family protein [Brevifollis gellanilyticus]|uniref:LPS kinase n=1 Tax=Brevifollis gellanilyticus TaxID=748831 RepID=A0A512M4S5_9BACT|nr:lipopolysaccharide kinase InaA family protein [Brevifollis gellanilyticus]GEP41727.1 hypothetical protein BGE01nite_10180 [Brevifollis gellanilyticus]